MSKISSVMRSNLFTMGVASKNDPRQSIPAQAQIPAAEVRKLRARLIMEEALETCAAMGAIVCLSEDKQRSVVEENSIGIKSMDDLQFVMDPVYLQNASDEDRTAKLIDILDGCCDSIYVNVGTMAVCGIADQDHLDEVCRANDAKFPNGEATTDANGKYQKPPGWEGPRHLAILRNPIGQSDLKALSASIIGNRVRRDTVTVNQAMAAAPDDVAFMLRQAHVNVTDSELEVLSSDERVAALRWANAYLNAKAEDKPKLISERPEFLPAPSC
jgi:predicted HAD superfamily Cof-like phosphohydrolase